MSPMWMSTPAILAVASLLVRLVNLGRRSSRIDRLADLALLVAVGFVVWSVADPAAWTGWLVSAPPHGEPELGDMRDAGAIAAALATLAALPGLFGGSDPRRLSWVTALTPGVLIAALAVAALALTGLRDSSSLTMIAMGAFVAGTALLALFRSSRSPARLRGRALMLAGLAVAWSAAALPFAGARSDAVDLRPGESVDALGYSLWFRFAEAAGPDDQRLHVEVQRGRRVSECTPTIGRDPRGRPRGRAAGGLTSGPIMAVLRLHALPEHAHPMVWLARGDTTRVGAALVRFDGFRMVNADTIRVFADLSVTHDGRTEIVSPGMLATASGSRPFSAEIPGAGPVALAKMDADQGRVALMLPRAPSAPAFDLATVRLQTRPGLPVAWAGLALALLAAGFALWPEPRPVAERAAP